MENLYGDAVLGTISRMNKKIVVILLVVVALAVTGAYFMKPAAEAESAPGENTPMEGSADLPPPAALEFKDYVVLMDGGYAIDGGTFVAASCAETDPAFRFASLAIGPEALAELTCLDDYMGGVSIKLDRAQPPLYEKLGLRFSDAGEASDKRSWVRRTPEGVTIDVVTMWSQSNVDPDEAGQANIQCGATYERITISSKDFAVTKAEIASADPKAYPFEPPAKIDSKCL